MSLFFSFVWLFSSTPCFLFSFSQALGKPKPPSGCLGFPLCFFELDAIAHSDPYISPCTYTKVTRPHLFFFFFFVVVARFPAWVFSGFLSLWWSVSWLCKMILLHLGGVGRQDISRPLGQLLSRLFWGLGEDPVPRRNLCTIFCRTGLTPPTPILLSAVKYSPGRGWGRPREGDLGPATVLSLLIG